jgi:hypothetical protein
MADLLGVARTMENADAWPQLAADHDDVFGSVANGNWTIDQLFAILRQWSHDNGVNHPNEDGLGVVAVLSGDQNFYRVTNDENYHPIFIYNDNAQANNGGGSHVPTMNHYEGMRAESDPDALSSADVVAIDAATQT